MFRKKIARNFFEEIELEAKKKLPKEIYDHIAGGAGDELTLDRNRSAFSEIALVPNVLQGVDKIDTSISIFGAKCKAPIIIAPTAFHGLVSSEKEIGTVCAAQEAGCIMSVSMMANSLLEEIATKSQSLWFQLHLHADFAITEKLIKRAENSGYKAIIITVDIPQMGKRYRDIKNEFKLPNSCIPINFLENDDEINIKDIQFNPSATWENVKLVRAITKLPILLKGILDPNDALQAERYGADGIIVSNHGGRQLDGAVATIDALPSIVSVINGRIPVFIDGGIRSGNDILKAIALGADAVLVGRPILWGLAVAGRQGVTQVLTTFIQELILAMQLVGCHSLSDVKKKNKQIIFSYGALFMNQSGDPLLISEIRSLREELVQLSRNQEAAVHSLIVTTEGKIRSKL